jgi:hypothetical protein
MYSELQRTPGWTDLDIFKITYDEYMAFSRQYMAGQITSNPLSPAQNSYTSPTDSVALFMKSIKREPKDFPVIKLLTQWDSVKCAVNATATIQSIAEVLNHAYIPSAMDKPLFDLKNSYWYKVLVDIIQESSLWAIVNAGPVGDGQTVWTNIVTEAERSTTARISSQSLTAYLTTSKIRDGSWQGTDTANLNHWNKQMHKLVEYSPTTPMTDDFKLTLLKNAVQEAPHLASVESAYDVTTQLGSGTPDPSTIMVTWRSSFLLLRIMTPRFRQLLDPRIDVPTFTRHFLQSPMMRDSTTSIPALTLYGLMLIIPYWHNTATVWVYLMTRGPNFRKILGTSG